MADIEPIPLRDPMVHDLHIRVDRLEQAAITQHTDVALVKNDVSYLKDGIDNINGGIRKLFWMAFGTIFTFLTTVLGFLLYGGSVNLP